MLAIVVAAAVSIPGWLLVAAMEKIRSDYHSRVEVIGTKGVLENSRIIARLERSVDILDQRVEEALQGAKYSMRNVQLVPVVVTACNPVVTQTEGVPQIITLDKPVRRGMFVRSRDLEEEFGFESGDTVAVVGFATFVFENGMNKRPKDRVVILMPSWKFIRHISW